MALFSKKNIKREYSDPLYAYFEALDNKWTDEFDIDNPIDREQIEDAIAIIEAFDKGQVIFHWYQSSSEIYLLIRKLMDNRVKYDQYIYKNKSYYDFWTSVHKTLLTTYLANREII